MRKTIKLAVIAAALTFAVLGVAHAELTPDSSGTFAIQVAQGWSVQQSEDMMSLVGPNSIPQVNVSSQELQGVTLAQFKKAFPSQMKKELNSFKLVSSANAKIGGTPAGLWVYTAKVEGTVLKFKNYVLFKDGNMYNIVFATLPQRFTSDVKGFDSMIKSWNWAEK